MKAHTFRRILGFLTLIIGTAILSQGLYSLIIGKPHNAVHAGSVVICFVFGPLLIRKNNTSS